MQPAEFLEWLCDSDQRPGPSIAVVVAHPDDEVIGLGSRLPRLRHAVLVHVTDGAPQNGRDAAASGLEARAEYGLVRRRELGEALRLAGVNGIRTWEFFCVDQQAALRMPGLTYRLVEFLSRFRPEVILTHPYEGGHPDHDATALVVHAARALLSRTGGLTPQIVEMSSYHNSSRGIEPETFLPHSGSPEVILRLSPEQSAFKRRLLACFRTQQETLRYFPAEVERFRQAPRYDFTRPAHEGKLFYELFDWGMTGPRFRELARQALAEFDLAGAI